MPAILSRSIKNVVAEAFVGSNDETFPIAPLPQGLYVVRVGDESATISF